jgi:hypothetical protein
LGGIVGRCDFVSRAGCPAQQFKRLETAEQDAALGCKSDDPLVALECDGFEASPEEHWFAGRAVTVCEELKTGEIDPAGAHGVGAAADQDAIGKLRRTLRGSTPSRSVA